MLKSRLTVTSTSDRGKGIQTDNAHLREKVYLRRRATEGLGGLRVLDLFAGENVLWSHFTLDRYYGVEQQRGKGRNLWADNRKVIPSLDLSDFNVIDVDSYGIPFAQMQQVFDNPTLSDGTVIVYTCIGNSVSGLCNEMKDAFGIRAMYDEASTLFNGYGMDYFYGYLYRRGVRKVVEYRSEGEIKFNKVYGYFTYRAR